MPIVTNAKAEIWVRLLQLCFEVPKVVARADAVFGGLSFDQFSVGVVWIWLSA
jgi:hypothetical protein